MVAFLIYILITQLPESVDPVRQVNHYYVGTSVGGGLIRVTDNQTPHVYGRASLPNLKLGYHLRPDLALTLNFPGGIHQRADRHRAFEATMPGIQYWANKRLWVSAGAGLSIDRAPIYEDQDNGPEGDYLGAAFGASVGYEVYQQKNYAIELQLRTMYGSNRIEDHHRTNFATDLVAGLNWYF